MEEITVKQVRRILENILIGDFYLKKLAQTTNNNLLKMNLRVEFDLDSLDFMDLLNNLQELYGIELSEEAYDCLLCNPTAQNFIDLCNK